MVNLTDLSTSQLEKQGLANTDLTSGVLIVSTQSQVCQLMENLNHMMSLLKSMVKPLKIRVIYKVNFINIKLATP